MDVRIKVLIFMANNKSKDNMKQKIENFLYFLTIWFSVSVIVLWVIGFIFKLVTKINK